MEERKIQERIVAKLTALIDKVYDLLAEKEWDQKRLSKETGILAPVLSEILNYKRKNLTLETIAKLELAFGTDLITTPDDYEEELVANPSKLQRLIDAINAKYKKDFFHIPAVVETRLPYAPKRRFYVPDYSAHFNSAESRRNELVNQPSSFV